MEDERKKKIQTVSLVLVGVDPGSTNMGIGAIRFNGLVEYTDPETGGIRYLPDIEIIAMERWNLKTGEIDQPTKRLDRKMTIPLRPNNNVEKREEMLDWCDSATKAIARSEWLHQPFLSSFTDKEELPILVVENQCDVQKTQGVKNEMTVIQYIMTSAIQGIDGRFIWKSLVKNPSVREVHLHIRKYGQRNDGSRERTGRKEKAVGDLEELLFQLNTVNSLQWLAYLNRMTANRGQTHDMSDAILLAVDKALSLYDGHLKALKASSTDKEEKKLLQEERKKIPLAPIQRKPTEPEFTDENLPSQSDCVSGASLGKRKRKDSQKQTKEPTEKTPVKRRKKTEEVLEEEKDEKKKKKNEPVVIKKKPAVVKKKPAVVIVDMEVEESPPPIVLEKKKRVYKRKDKKDSESIASKYPKLLLDFTGK